MVALVCLSIGDDEVGYQSSSEKFVWTTRTDHLILGASRVHHHPLSFYTVSGVRMSSTPPSHCHFRLLVLQYTSFLTSTFVLVSIMNKKPKRFTLQCKKLSDAVLSKQSLADWIYDAATRCCLLLSFGGLSPC